MNDAKKLLAETSTFVQWILILYTQYFSLVNHFNHLKISFKCVIIKLINMATPKKTATKAPAKTASKTAAKAATNGPAAKQPDPVVHFEMPAEDRKRMSKFYNKAFGWQTQMLGADMGNYVLATTTELTKNGMPKKKGAINGGFYEKTKDMPAQYPSVAISVDSIKKAMNKITKAGGSIIGEPMEIPGFGTYVSFYDTEGNRVSIMEPTIEMKEKTR